MIDFRPTPAPAAEGTGGTTGALSVIASLLTAAGLIFEAERATNPAFSTFGDAIYFAITTLTTVGFGDVVPFNRCVRTLLSDAAAPKLRPEDFDNADTYEI